MRTLIKKSCRQLKRLKKIRRISVFITRGGLVTTCIGYVGFFLTIMKMTGPNLMITSFTIGVPMMIAGSLANELAIYQEIRLRAKFHKYSHMIQTILHRHDGEIPLLSDEELNGQDVESAYAASPGHHSLVCSGV